MTDKPPVTPASLRDLAGRAETLAADIEAARRAIRSQADEAVRRRSFRLLDAPGVLQGLARDLLNTASDLARVAARPDGSCGIPWGVCPEHGDTLAPTGESTRCRTCGQTWNHDRQRMPCPEPVRWMMLDQHGEGQPVCDGHAVFARKELIGGTVEPLPPAASGEEQQ
ncbi:hypothetical protein [Streptosporangium sp. NPDC048865]|uniref:hypothetical protein n=1 Tax=Streptosporangium sp. NPDC048865 TaxID=3155766 RepID=UPI00342E32E9